MCNLPLIEGRGINKSLCHNRVRTSALGGVRPVIFRADNLLADLLLNAVGAVAQQKPHVVILEAGSRDTPRSQQ